MREREQNQLKKTDLSIVDLPLLKIFARSEMPLVVALCTKCVGAFATNNLLLVGIFENHRVSTILVWTPSTVWIRGQGGEQRKLLVSRKASLKQNKVNETNQNTEHSSQGRARSEFGSRKTRFCRRERDRQCRGPWPSRRPP